MNKFIVGSNAFFSCYDDFKPNDNDILLLEETPSGYKYNSQIRLNGNCYFKWRKMSSKKFIELHKKSSCGMLLGKFLVPEFVNEIGFTVDDLKELKNLYDNIDDRHSYEKIIYDSYISNNSFCLTDEQRLKAYNEYKSKRK